MDATIFLIRLHEHTSFHYHIHKVKKTYWHKKTAENKKSQQFYVTTSQRPVYKTIKSKHRYLSYPSVGAALNSYRSIHWIHTSSSTEHFIYKYHYTKVMANRLSRPLFLPDMNRSCIIGFFLHSIIPSWRIIRCRSLLVLVLAILFSKIMDHGPWWRKKKKGCIRRNIPYTSRVHIVRTRFRFFVRFNKNAQSHWL